MEQIDFSKFECKHLSKEEKEEIVNSNRKIREMFNRLNETYAKDILDCIHGKYDKSEPKKHNEIIKEITTLDVLQNIIEAIEKKNYKEKKYNLYISTLDCFDCRSDQAIAIHTLDGTVLESDLKIDPNISLYRINEVEKMAGMEIEV